MAPSVPQDAIIERERTRIDQIDATIIDLIKARRQASQAVQEARISAGGRRTETAREMEIIRRYSSSLGKPGATLAMTFLEICRGSAPVADAANR